MQRRCSSKRLPKIDASLADIWETRQQFRGQELCRPAGAGPLIGRAANRDSLTLFFLHVRRMRSAFGRCGQTERRPQRCFVWSTHMTSFSNTNSLSSFTRRRRRGEIVGTPAASLLLTNSYLDRAAVATAVKQQLKRFVRW